MYWDNTAVYQTRNPVVSVLRLLRLNGKFVIYFLLVVVTNIVYVK